MRRCATNLTNDRLAPTEDGSPQSQRTVCPQHNRRGAQMPSPKLKKGSKAKTEPETISKAVSNVLRHKCQLFTPGNNGCDGFEVTTADGSNVEVRYRRCSKDSNGPADAELHRKILCFYRCELHGKFSVRVIRAHTASAYLLVGHQHCCRPASGHRGGTGSSKKKHNPGRWTASPPGRGRVRLMG